MEWRNIFRGMAMGISDVVPGVSGGTIAVILGIYDQLIASINGLFSKQWRRHLSFLIPLAFGMGGAILLFSRVMKWLLAHQYMITFYFFIGLIIGILPFLFREVQRERNLTWYHFLFVILGLVCIMLLPEAPDKHAVITQMDMSVYVLLFFAGFLASAAMILPGISGSFVLLVLGVYNTIIHAVNDFDVKILFIVACGIAIGIVLMSKLIHLALQYFRTATFSFIIGLVIGSIFVIFPGWSASFGQLVASVVVFFGGLLTAYTLGKIEH